MAKTVYFSMTTHPNMNYDRSVKSVIWEAFPKLYRLYLDYLRDHPQLRTHMQLPPQTLLSLKQCAPDVIESAQALRRRGQLRFMGTFFSESIAQCQDGMSMLDAAEWGCGVASTELDADLEGFFLQEIAYTPQIPYMIARMGVQWTILRDWEGSFKPFWVEGLDGTRCVGVPMIEGAQQAAIKADPECLPDNALIITHCDMEIPVTLKHMHDLEQFLRNECGYETRWCFVSDYIEAVGVEGVKRVTPCTNKAEGRTESPSFSRWCGDHLSMAVHRHTLDAMEARRAAALAAGAVGCDRQAARDVPSSRPDTTWNVETPAIYPELSQRYLKNAAGEDSPFKRLAMLIAWGSNSDGRGWYPLLERRLERTDSFDEATAVANRLLLSSLSSATSDTRPSPSLCAVNPHGVSPGFWHTLTADQPFALRDADGRDAVQWMERDGSRWCHHLRLEVPPYSCAAWRKQPSDPRVHPEDPGASVSNDVASLRLEDGVVHLERPSKPGMAMAPAPFEVCVKSIDTALRAPRPENDWCSRVVDGPFPRLIVTRQLDYHVHFRADYVLDGTTVYADWRFWFTYPTLVDGLDHWDADGPKTDFTPGGLCAMLDTGQAGRIRYDVPFGVVEHPFGGESFVAPLTHAFLQHEAGGVSLASRDGSQSFKVHADRGRLGVCMGKSITSGGRRKLGFRVGDRIDDFAAETDWYKEFFYGELRHRFVVIPYEDDWRDHTIPNLSYALANGPRLLETLERIDPQTLAILDADNVRIAGLDPEAGTVVLAEMCGRETHFSLRLGTEALSGTIGPYGIQELTCRLPAI